MAIGGSWRKEYFGTVQCLIVRIKKFSLVIFRMRQEGVTNIQVKSFQSITLPAVCKFGLVILEAGAVRKDRERNRRQEAELIEYAFHLGHITSVSYWCIFLSTCIGKQHSTVVPLFLPRLLPLIFEKL